MREELQVYAEQLVRGKNVPGIIVKQRVSDLPFNATGDAKAAFWNASIYLAANNISDAQDARWSVFHEFVGHFGLVGFFGNHINYALDDLYKNNTTIQQTINMTTYKKRGYAYDVTP